MSVVLASLEKGQFYNLIRLRMTLNCSTYHFFFLEEEDILQLNYNDLEVKNMYLLTGHALYRQNGT